MKNLFNLGVSDPLTLGMAHPIADRLETLGRARALTKGGRATVLTVLGGLVVFSAPFTVAADNKAAETKLQSGVVSSLDEITYHSYEITERNGEKRAFLISEDGTPAPMELEELEGGRYRLTSSDGKIINIPNVDDLGLDGLKNLKNLETLDGFEGLVQFQALEKLALGSDDLKAFEFNLDDFEYDSEALIAQFPESIRGMLENTDGKKEIRIVKSGNIEDFDFSKLGGKTITLPDTVVDMNFAFVQDSHPLGQALRQLERTERQLSELAKDENLAFDIENAMRDLENARESLKAAEEHLQQE